MKKATQKIDRKSVGFSLGEAFKSMLAEVHPCLPAYFCARSGAIVPILTDEDADEKMAELGLTKLDPDGHIDRDVLWAIYELFAEHDDGFWSPYHPQRAISILRKALRNPNSKLSQAIARAYGEEK
jgi:hypothetical protein